MPSFITVPFLLAVIAIGAAVAAFLLLVTSLVRVIRHLRQRRWARQDALVRPAMLRAAAGEGLGPELLRARGARGRAVDRMAFAYLARLRGEGHDRMAEVLERRGVVARIVRQSARGPRNRRAARASQLGLIASAGAERQLERMALRDPSARVRMVAARGLGKTGTAEAAGTLITLVTPRSGVPEGIVASALLELGPDAATGLRRAICPGDGTARADGGLSRSMAADVLGLLDEMTAWPDLVSCAADPDPAVRVSAVRALGRLGMPQAAGAVQARLDPAEAPQVRAEAARALGRIADPGAVPALAACLDEADYWVAHNAAVALAALGQPGRQVLARAARAGNPHAREALDLSSLGAAAAAGGRR